MGREQGQGGNSPNIAVSVLLTSQFRKVNSHETESFDTPVLQDARA